MSTTPNLMLPYLAAAQSQKHVTLNEAIRSLDAIVQLAVLDRDQATPPVAPDDGSRYIVADDATGAWADQERKIAAYQDGAWAFLTPRPGWLAWLIDEQTLLTYDGADWIAAAQVPAVNPAPLIGVNATADATNRLAVKSDAVLFSHDDVTPGTGDIRHVMNKATSADTASLLFQTDWSGRVEFGVAGDDDLRIKVSPDGTIWHDALIVANGTGAVAIPRRASPWNGRKWVAVGTSITAQGHYTTPLAGMIEASLVNLAVGGATLPASMIEDQIPLIPADADLVTLEAGINDFPSGLVLGSLGDATTASFHGALHVAIDAIMDRAPNAFIVLLTPFSAGPGPTGELPSHIASRTYRTTNSGTVLRQWQQAVRDVAAWTGWPVIDIAQDAGLNWWTAGEYTFDGLHPIGAGGVRMARFIADKLIEMRPRAGGYIPPVSGSTLDPLAIGTKAVLSNGNFDLSTTDSNWTSAKGSLAHDAGQHYFEALLVSLPSHLNTLVGLADETATSAGLNTYPGNFSHSIAVRGDQMYVSTGSVISAAAIPAAYSAVAGDTIMVAVDFDGGSIWFGRNGVWFNGTPVKNATTGRNGSFTPELTLSPALGVAGTGNTVRFVPSAAEQIYAPPAGFGAWG